MNDQKEITMPKVIHYCWFGGNELPEKVVKCIESWKKYFPDYEIKEWNESNYDINICDYVREAYQAKKWAFVSDYARFDILYKYGGLYLDTDVEIIKDFHDLIGGNVFLGREPIDCGGKIAPGLIICAPPKMNICKYMIDIYNQAHFISDDNNYNYLTVVDRITAYYTECGFDIELNNIQNIDGVIIYPAEYFCPVGWNGVSRITNNSRTIHHYDASWFPKLDRWIFMMQKKQGEISALKSFFISLILIGPRLCRKIKFIVSKLK